MIALNDNHRTIFSGNPFRRSQAIGIGLLLLILLAGEAAASINLNLTGDQWLQDLKILDSHIRNRHINPFFHNDERGYTDLYDQAHEYLNSTTTIDTDIINGYIERLVAYTGDGHSFVSGRSARYGVYPFYLKWFGDDLYIKMVDQARKNLLGAKVLALDDVKLPQANDLMRPFSPHVNKSSFKRESVSLYGHPGLLFAAGISQSADEIKLQLELSDGKRVTQLFVENTSGQDPDYAVLRESDKLKTPLYRHKANKKQWLKYLPDEDALYVHHGLVVEEEAGDISRFTGQITDAINSHTPNKLIIDLRNNPGGNSYLNAQLINAITNTPQINQRGQLFVLTNQNTFSAAINFAGNMEMRTKAIFIGEKVGDTATFTGESGPKAQWGLPNSHIVANLSFSEWNATFDYDQRNSVGLDIPVTLTLNDFVTARDPVLQAALDYESSAMNTMALSRAQRKNWVGRYDYSADKAMKIFEHEGQLKLEVTELVFSDLYPLNDSELLTDISGLSIKRLTDGTLLMLQQGNIIHELNRIPDEQLKPLELLVSGRFAEAKAAYQQVYRRNPELLSVRGNSLGILASHLRARYDNPTLYLQLREIALSLHGYPIVSWDEDDLAI